MKIILYIIILLVSLSSSVFAESTFFDQDDAFIMGGSTTSETSRGSTLEGETSGNGCLTNWTCSDWDSCNAGVQVRNCTKEKIYCYADLKKKPIERQNCFADKSGDKNNTGDWAGNSPVSFNNLNLFSIKIIVIVILIVIVIGLIILYKRHRKRRYFHYGY